MPAGLLKTVETSSARDALPANTVATDSALFSRTAKTGSYGFATARDG